MFTGRTAVITGGAQGIGLAIARTFAEHGARIVIGDLDETKAKQAASSLTADAIGRVQRHLFRRDGPAARRRHPLIRVA